MNERPKSPSEILQAELNKATAEKSVSERLKEREEKYPLHASLFKGQDIDLTKQPE